MLGCSPAAPEISLEPAEPTSIEDLFLKAESEHGLRVEWFVDRLPAAVDGMTVPASMTTRGEQWAVRVTPISGRREGEPSTAVVSILNTPPTVSVTVEGGHAEQALEAFVETHDPDGDSVSVSYRWYRDGEPTELTTASVLSTWTANEELWEVEVTPNDGLDDGAPARAGVTIGNAPPVVDSVVILPKPPTSTDTLVAEVQTTDVDGDTVDLYFEWLVDGESVSEESELPPLPRDHVVVVRVTPFDGQRLGETVESDPVGIQNGAPPKPTVRVLSQSTHAGWDAECVSETSVEDPDGDVLQDESLWYIDGALVQEPSAALEGQTLTCVLELDDGHGGVVDGRDDVVVLWACETLDVVDTASGSGTGPVNHGDVDADGYEDLLIGDVVWYGPDFTSSEALGLPIQHGVGIGDLDGDGVNEVVASNSEEKTLIVLWGDGSQEVINQGDVATDVDLADVDGDGELDIVMQCLSGANYRPVREGSVLGQSSLNSLQGRLRVVDSRVAQLDGSGDLYVGGVLTSSGLSGFSVDGEDLLVWSNAGLLLLEADGLDGFDPCPVLDEIVDGAADFDGNGKPDAVSLVQGWEIRFTE